MIEKYFLLTNFLIINKYKKNYFSMKQSTTKKKSHMDDCCWGIAVE
jgi:hypothetical protein